MTVSNKPNWRELPSPNHGPRRNGAAIDMLIIHYTGMTDTAVALRRLCDPSFTVSAHYLIDEGGTVWRLVPEERRAWHAGTSFWAGESDINSCSIGIELVNPGHGPNYRAFPDAQMMALEELARGVLSRHSIPAHRILGHADVAPDRKQDPGELFDWKRLAEAGVGLWPEPIASEEVNPTEFSKHMCKFGYADSSSEAITAFQRHFHPTAISGIADDETRARLLTLVKKSGLG